MPDPGRSEPQQNLAQQVWFCRLIAGGLAAWGIFVDVFMCVLIGSDTVDPTLVTPSVTAVVLAIVGMAGAFAGLYVLGSWREDGLIPRHSYHQLLVPAAGLGNLALVFGAGVWVTVAFVRVEAPFREWIADRAVGVAPTSLPRTVAVLGLSSEPETAGFPPRVRALQRRALGRGVVLNVAPTTRLHPATLQLPDDRRAYDRSDVDWIAFVEREADPLPDRARRVWLRLVDAEGAWLAVGVTSSKIQTDHDVGLLVDAAIASVEAP